MRTISAAIGAVAIAVLLGCTTGQPNSAAPTAPSPATEATTASVVARPSASPSPADCSATRQWTTAEPGYDADYPGGPVSGVTLSLKESPCFERLEFSLDSNPRVTSHASYVTRDEVVGDASNRRVLNVTGQSFLRVVIGAPAKTSPPLGMPQVADDVVAKSQIIAGVWYGGGQHNQSVYYVGLKTAPHAFKLGGETGPRSGAVLLDLVR